MAFTLRLLRKESPDAGDVHVDAPMGSGKKKKKKKKKAEMKKFDDPTKGSVSHHDIVKVDSEERIAWGWASVVMEKGQIIVDRQGHQITPTEMEKAANDFMADVRLAKAMHQGGGIGEVIHSFVVTDEICKAFDIECEKRGWIIAMKIHDDETWELVKSGALKAFSIGGKGSLTDVQ